jgi:acetoin utilization protein AcuB
MYRDGRISAKHTSRDVLSVERNIMRVAEIMTTRVRTVGPADAAELAWERMRLHRIHHLVVTRDWDIVGVITDRDLGGRRGRELREGRSVRDLMTPAVTTVTPGTTVREAANLMRGHGAGCLPVVEGRSLVGIVTVWDLIELIGRGAERPVASTSRWILKDRGPGRAKARTRAPRSA